MQSHPTSSPYFRENQSLVEFESSARFVGVTLEATQLGVGNARVGFGIRHLGEGALASYQTSHSLGVTWEARPQAISFSVRVGRVGMKIEGRERAPYSLVVYAEPGTSGWTGTIDGTSGVEDEVHPSYHVSVPISAAGNLGIPVERIRRGWHEIPLDPEVARHFATWADQTLQDANPRANQGELYGWLHQFLGSATQDLVFESPSHYTRIITLVIALADEHVANPLSVSQISSKLRISVRTIQRAFQTVFGMGVSRFLRHRRLKRADHLLRSGETTVYRAAYDAGFHHVPRFSQQYRRLFGHSPSAVLA